LLGALCLLFALVQLAAFHWGVITPDSVVQYGQALTGRYDDWHPPVTAWLWRQLLHFGPGGAPFLLLDIGLYWGGFGLIAAAVRERHGWGWAALVLAIGLLPIPFGQVGAILKDPLMACLLLMATALLMRREQGGPTWLALVALPLILIASATRINALFAALPMLLLAVPRAWTTSVGRVAACAAAGLVLLITSGWAINDAMLKPAHAQPIYSLINFDLAGILAHGGPNPYPGLTDARARAMAAVCYDPRMFGAHEPPLCAIAEDSLEDHVQRTGDSPIGIWLNAILSAPGAYARHRLAHLNWNWRLFLPQIPNDAVYMMSQPNPYGLQFSKNALTRIVGGAARAMAWTPLGRPASWLAVALGLLLAAPRLPSRRLVAALAVSALLYGGAYALVSVAPDLRYNLWTMLAAMLGLAFTLAERAVLSRRRQLLAVIPAALTVLVELIGLAAG
jgi:hypothetical protein